MEIGVVVLMAHVQAGWFYVDGRFFKAGSLIIQGFVQSGMYQF